MFFDNLPGGEHPPVRTEAHIHAIYRKLFSLVKSMEKPDEIARSLIISLQGLLGADGAVLCHIFDDGARFVSAIGSLSHMKDAPFDLNNPIVIQFFKDNIAQIVARETLPQELLSICQYARFESLLLSPIAINGMSYGLIAFVSDRKGYFEQADADTIFQITRFLSMMLENRAFDISENERRHTHRLGETCMVLAPGLHKGVIDLIQTFSQMRRYYIEQRYPLMAELLVTAVTDIENMSKSVQDLRTLAEICLPKDKNLSCIELRPIIENAVEYNRVQIEECCELNLQIAEDLPSVYGDFTLIWKSLHELIQNAIRAMNRKESDKHVLTVHAYRVASSATIEIADTGIGIEPADAQHIYEPFFTTWAPCRGLGLSQARINTLILNGTIFYHPRKEGGSVFSITLPDGQHAPQTEMF